MKNSKGIVSGIVVLLIVVGVAILFFVNQQVNTNSLPTVTASPTVTSQPTASPHEFEWSTHEYTLSSGYEYTLTFTANQGYSYDYLSYITGMSPVEVQSTQSSVSVSGSQMNLNAYFVPNAQSNKGSTASITLIPTSTISLSVNVRDGTGVMKQDQNTASPTITPHPTATATPSPSPAPVGSIAISYNIITEQYYTWVGASGTSYTQQADSGKVFLEVTMTITNNGYSSFSTNPYYFSLTTNNIKYSYDSGTFSLNKWSTVDVLNGGTFSGTILFQVPSTSSGFSLSNSATTSTYPFPAYNIIWTQT